MRSIIAVFLLSVASMAWGQGEKGPKAKADDRPNRGGQTKSQSQQQIEHSFKTPLIVQLQNPDSAKAVSNGNAGKGSEQVSDHWTIFGYRMKVTDFLQVFFNGLLFVVTVGLVIVGTKQWRVSKDTAKAQLRAYVGIEAGGLKFASFDPSLPRMRFFNFGQTPACRVRVCAGISKDFRSIDRRTEVQLLGHGLLMSPKNHAALNFVKNPSVPSGKEDTFCVHGVIEYTDNYGERWGHKFVWTYGDHGEATHSWMPEHPGNEEKSLGKDPEA